MPAAVTLTENTLGARLRLRREVFELCLLPLAPLLPLLPDSPAALQSFQRRLLAHSVPSGSAPERRLVSAAAVADCLGVAETVAACLLDVLEAAQPDAPPAGAAPPGEADMHAVLLLLFVNMYARPHVQSQLRNAGDVWPAPGAPPAGAQAAPPAQPPPAGEAAKPGGPASPTKPRRVSHPAGEHDEALQTAFVMRHLAALLPLLRSTPAAGAAGADVQLSTAEFDRIGFLFAVAAHPAGTRLSDVAPAFAGGVQKSIALPAARDWLSRALLPCAPPGAPPRPGDCAVEGAAKTTVLLREADVAPGGCVRLADCHEAVVYVLAPCGLASLVNCSDCTVVVGAAGRALRLEGCERCCVVAAARHVQVRGCHGGVLHLAAARPPLALGDTRGVRVAPYNTHYDALQAHLQAAGLGALAGQAGAWARHVQLPPPPPGAPPPAGAKPPLAPLPAEEFCPFVVPFSARAGPPAAEGDAPPPPPPRDARAPAATTANPFPLPAAYAEATEAKVRRVGELQAAVREAALDESRRRELQAAIQAHFRDWLVSSGNMRQIFDLSRLQ